MSDAGWQHGTREPRDRAQDDTQKAKKWGRLPPPPKDNLETTPAGRRTEKGKLQSFALNSTWKRRGSLYDAVYGTPTAADRLLRPDT